MQGTDEKAKAGTLFQSAGVGGCDFPIRYVYYDDEGLSYPDLLREGHDDPIGVCMNPLRQARVSKETEAAI